MNPNFKEYPWWNVYLRLKKKNLEKFAQVYACLEKRQRTRCNLLHYWVTENDMKMISEKNWRISEYIDTESVFHDSSEEFFF